MYKVLLVDDDPAERFLHRRLKTWEECGFKLTEIAANGVDVINAMQKEKFDLVVTDIRMPFLDGIEFLKKIRVTDSVIPVIFISSYSEFQYAQQGIVYGAFDYITKPIDEEKLADVLRRVAKYIEEQNPPKIDNVILELLDELGLSEQDDDFIRQIAEYSTEHYREEVSCEACACLFGYHEKYFGKIFTQHFGITFRKYWGHMRIAHAIELLRSGRYRVVEVSEMLGYSSYKYFNQKFKEVTGVTPTNYKYVSKNGGAELDILY